MFLRVIGLFFISCFMIFCSWLFSACGGDSCKTSLDCATGQICLKGSCKKRVGCKKTSDCGKGLACVKNVCKSSSDGGTAPDKKAPDYGKGKEGFSPEWIHHKENKNPVKDDGTPVDTEPSGPVPVAGELIINEILADPPSGDKGDANKDKTPSTTQDEFIEIVNISDKELDLKGVAVFDEKGKVLFRFPAGARIKAKQAAVIFGGGLKNPESKPYVNTNKAHPGFEDALVYTKGLSLTNTSKILTLKTSDGKELDRFGYGVNGCPGGSKMDQSITRFPEWKGTCAKHSAVSPSGMLFSPGTQIDGRGFDKPLLKRSEPKPEGISEKLPDAGEKASPDQRLAEQAPIDQGSSEHSTNPESSKEARVDRANPEIGLSDSSGVAKTPVSGDLVVNELMADPPAGAIGDANKDGSTSARSDEFIELVNKSIQSLKMDGVVLKDQKGKILFTVPKGVTLKSRQALVVFGGGMQIAKHTPYINKGTAHPFFGNALVYTKSLSLTNTSKTVILQNASGQELDRFAYGVSSCPGGSSVNQSLTRAPDITGACSLHSKAAQSGGKLFSPGTKVDGKPF